MFRYICLTLILVLALGNILRLESADQRDLGYWVSLALLLFSTVRIFITLPADLKRFQKHGKMNLREFKNQDDIFYTQN